MRITIIYEVTSFMFNTGFDELELEIKDLRLDVLWMVLLGGQMLCFLDVSMNSIYNDLLQALRWHVRLVRNEIWINFQAISFSIYFTAICRNIPTMQQLNRNK
jgi:hypothetical protein